MKKKAVLVLLCLILSLSACGKKEKLSGINYSLQDVNFCYTEEGLVHTRPSTAHEKGKMDYLDYETGSYYPLCAKANCRHDGPDCTAVYFAETSGIGRLGNKWYRFLFAGEVFAGDYSTEIRSYDLDGGNEKTVAVFPHEIDFRTIFYERYCITVTNDYLFDEETHEWLGNKSGIYRIDLETGKYELLCPEREGKNIDYYLYGITENNLIYREWTGTIHELRMMDLDTGEIKNPLPGKSLAMDAFISGNEFVCNVTENNSNYVVRIDLKTGEWEKILINGKEQSAHVFWSPEMKILTVSDDDHGLGELRYERYLYSEDGSLEFIGKGGEDTYMELVTVKNDLVVGKIYRENILFDLVKMDKEDFLAGKTNWTVLEY